VEQFPITFGEPGMPTKREIVHEIKLKEENW
jgi:hypothetical protein